MCSHQTAHAPNLVVSIMARPKPLRTKHRATQNIHTDKTSILCDKYMYRKSLWDWFSHLGAIDCCLNAHGGNEEEISINLITDELVVEKVPGKKNWSLRAWRLVYLPVFEVHFWYMPTQIRDTATETRAHLFTHIHTDTTTFYKQGTQQLPNRVFGWRYPEYNHVAVEKSWLSCRGHVRFLSGPRVDLWVSMKKKVPDDISAVWRTISTAVPPFEAQWRDLFNGVFIVLGRRSSGWIFVT